MAWECFCVVGFDLGPLLQGRARILHLQYFFKYVLAYFLHLDNYLVTFLHNTICRAQLFCPFLLSASEFLSNMLFNYHLLYFCTALSLIIMLSSHYHLHKSKTLSQLTRALSSCYIYIYMISNTVLLPIVASVVPDFTPNIKCRGCSSIISVASRMHFLRDHTLIRLQTRIFMESAVISFQSSGLVFTKGLFLSQLSFVLKLYSQRVT